MQAWGPHLEKNTVEGEKLGCTANSKDLKTRVRRLWLSGEDERAAKELKDLKDENDDDGYSLVDTLMISNLIGDGKVEEALKLLLKRYQGEHGRPGYLLLLGKAASAAGEYQMAVAAYQRAYDISPHGKNGAHALFQAAFTSYQMQDYDGASRRFEQLLKQRSTLARDAQWHLAWIRYLRGDYQGAYDSFAILSKQKVSKRVVRRRKGRKATVLVSSDNVAQDRIGYWSAMSLLKMNRGQEAAPHFMALAKDPSIGYYALLSYYRLLAIPGVKIPQEVEARWGLKRGDAATPSEDELKAAALSSAESAQADYEEEVTKADGEEETTDADAESEAEVPTETKTVTATVPVDEKAANFKDAGLAQKFERARDLVLVGLEDAARRELREIEKRARSSADRKLLMVEYANVKNYERSSFIAETGFGAERLRTGLKGESRPFWEHAYPRAWEQAVVQSSRSTSVPEELIWGIMRAESHFRFDAQSPVGALGLMQLMPFTGRKVADLLNIKAFETRSLLNPDTNIRLGSRYLQRLVEKFSGKVPLVAASYNAGPHRVYAWVRNFGSLDMDEFIEHIPYIETRNYVKRVVRNFQIYSLLYHKSADGMRWLIQPVGVQLGDQQAPREIW
jgi:soluble lytic murein transglycosylase